MKSNVLTAAFIKSVRHRGGRTADRYGDVLERRRDVMQGWGGHITGGGGGGGGGLMAPLPGGA